MTRTALVACLALSVPAVALAAPHSHRAEVRTDERTLRDDLRDAKQAQQLLKEFDRAAAARNRRTLAAVEARVARALEAETRETSRKAGEAAQELRQDAPKQGWEPSHDDVDLRSDRLADDMHRVDDRRDLMRESEYRRRATTIRDEWSSLRGHRERKAMARKHALLEELVRLSRYEIRRDVDELQDDREKLREGNHD